MRIIRQHHFLGILLFFLIRTSIAQQEAQYSMYFFNPLLINPGYAGSQDAFSATGVVRSQWTKLKGSPQSQCLTVHTPLKKETIGVGLTVLNDKVGAIKNTGAYLDGSIGVKLNSNKDRLVLGVKLGMDYLQRDFAGLRINETNDDVYTQNFSYNKTLFNAGAGLYYYGKRHYLGVSSPRIIKNKTNVQPDQLSIQENHFYGFGGVVIPLNSVFNLRPSFLVKYVKDAPLSVEGNLSLLMNDKIWLGAVYRHKAFAGLNAMYQINNSFKIGYAYDYSLNSIQQYSSNSHEIMLGYTFNGTLKGFRSPRYF